MRRGYVLSEGGGFMKRIFAVLDSLAFLTLATFITPAAIAQTTPAVPTVTGTLEGPRTAIFSSPENSCDSNDVPDAMPRAFRDYTGTIHFSSASSELFQSLGPTLETLQHSCDRAFKSANDPNPADYNDEEWLDSFFTLDGKNIAVLAHTEYHGWAVQGECNVQGNNQYSACEYDSDTFHLSSDGGYHFTTPLPPGNFVAGFPYQYQIDDGPMGYSVDSNMIELGGWYYAVATDVSWPPNCSGGSGSNPCLVPYGGAPLRTQNVFDPASWRAWGGSDFSVSFADPYAGPVSHPEEHVYEPVPYMIYINGIYLYKTSGLVVAALWDYWDGALGTPGLYLTTSTDMIHWTKPTLFVTRNDLMANDPKGNFLYVYFSLIDPNAPDLNFSVIGDEPYLYFVRLDNNNSSKRVLYRQRVKLTLNQ
jgi:hypothetical protein